LLHGEKNKKKQNYYMVIYGTPSIMFIKHSLVFKYNTNFL